MTGTRPAPAVAGPSYTLVLPHGWERVPLHEGVDERVRELVGRALADPPPGAAPDQVAVLRRQLQGTLLAAVERARLTGGVELYLPVGPVRGLAVPASFVVGQLPAQDDAPDPERLVAALVASDPTARALELGPHVAVRTERRVEQQARGPAPSRSVDYLVPTPDGRGWATVSFSTLVVEDHGEDVTDLLVELFDAVMTTFRWA